MEISEVIELKTDTEIKIKDLIDDLQKKNLHGCIRCLF